MFKPWTMKSFQGLVKFGIGCWIHLGTTLVYTKGKMSKWPWSLRPLKDISQGLHYPMTWFNGFCVGRGERGFLIGKGKGAMAKKCCYNNFLRNFFRGWEDEDKRRQENGETWIVPKLPFWDYIKKTSTFTSWCMVIPLGAHSVYT